MILFSGANTFRRYEEYDEMSQIIKDAALQHGVTVRILADIDDVIGKISRQNLREKEVQSISIQHLSRPQQRLCRNHVIIVRLVNLWVL